MLPAGATGDTATTPTDASGFANFQWDTTDPTASTVTITEQDPGGVIPGLVYDPALTTCTYRTPDLPDRTSRRSPPSTLGFIAPVVPPDAIVTCTIYNRLPAAPAIDIEKFTNGTDADTARPRSRLVPAATRSSGSTSVTNTGNVTLSQHRGHRHRDRGGRQSGHPPGHARRPALTTLAPGESFTCSADGTSPSAGQYENTGAVTGTSAAGVTVTDFDLSHYIGVEPGIDIEKATNGFGRRPGARPVPQTRRRR